MKINIFYATLVLLLQATVVVAQTAPAEQISQVPIGNSNNANRITISQPSAETLIELGRPVSGHPELDSAQTISLLTYNTYQGLLDLERQNLVPAWFVDEELQDSGLTRADLAGGLLVQSIPQVSIDIDVLKKTTDMLAEQAAHPELDGFCDSKWSKVKSKNIKKNKQGISKGKDANQGKLKGTLAYSGDVDVNILINYQTKENECLGIPYKARFVSAELDFKMNVVDQNFDVTGSITASNETNLFRENIPLWDYSDGIWVYFFYIDYAVELNLAYGADLLTSATFSAGTKMAGTIHKKWVCITADNCEKIDMPDDTGFTMTSNPVDTAISGDIKLKMYTDANIKGHIGFYKLDFLTALDLQIGIRAELPIRYFFYSGSTCEDADGDGTNEFINAGLIDVSAYVYGYLKYTGVVKGYRNFPIKMGGWTVAEPNDYVVDINGELTNMFYKKNIYFKSLGDNKIFDPVLRPSSPYGQSNGTLLVRARSCYPFDDGHATYLIDWGDNTSDETTAGTIPHGYGSLGQRYISAKPIRDSLGRKFENSDGTRTLVTVVSGDGVVDTSFGWLSPVINLILN